MIDIQENPQSKFLVIDITRPKKFFLKELSLPSGGVSITLEKPKLSFDEKDLHPILTYFAYTYMGRVYTKTLKHNKSNRQISFQKWLHPDLVGVSYPIGVCWDDS